jgi:hypothetical protein
MGAVTERVGIGVDGNPPLAQEALGCQPKTVKRHHSEQGQAKETDTHEEGEEGEEALRNT